MLKLSLNGEIEILLKIKTTLTPLEKELRVRTPFDAVQSWFQTKPEIFKILPNVFQDIVFEMVQRGET